jgi:signal transduction protein with GAF and PtsI domain
MNAHLSAPMNLPDDASNWQHAEDPHLEFLHELGSRIAAADPLHDVLNRVVEFATSIVRCDACLIYVHQGDKLVLRASKIPHAELLDNLDLQLGQGITGWVAENREPVAIAKNAAGDTRFKAFKDLPEDRFEAFLSVPLLSRGKLVGVINVQHKKPHEHTQREIQLLSTIGFLVGAEIEMARLEMEREELSDRLETRKVVDRAKGILQRDLKIDEESAYAALRKQSRQKRRSMRELAEAIVLSDELRRLGRTGSDIRHNPVK